MTHKKPSARLPCFPLYFSLLLSITRFPQEQTWDWLCIGVSPVFICLTSGPTSLHPHEREQWIKKKGRKEWKREVCLCPKGLVSVCVNQEVRMWQQQRHLFTVRVCVCVWTLWSWGVIYVKITAQAGGNQGWGSKSLKCQRQLCCDLLCGCEGVFWDIWWRLIPLLESESEKC